VFATEHSTFSSKASHNDISSCLSLKSVSTISHHVPRDKIQPVLSKKNDLS
jgi:hypothetical protein